MPLKPYKVLYQIVAQRTDEDDNVVGEIDVGRGILYAHQFAQLGDDIDAAWARIEAEHDPSPRAMAGVGDKATTALDGSPPEP